MLTSVLVCVSVLDQEIAIVEKYFNNERRTNKSTQSKHTYEISPQVGVCFQVLEQEVCAHSYENQQ